MGDNRQGDFCWMEYSVRGDLIGPALAWIEQAKLVFLAQRRGGTAGIRKYRYGRAHHIKALAPLTASRAALVSGVRLPPKTTSGLICHCIGCTRVPETVQSTHRSPECHHPDEGR